jgi:sporulation protein YlmC with PRC-barrel domain
MELDRNEQGHVEETGELARLSELDYEMEEGNPNIIGWTVVDDKGEEFAKVEDLLVDLGSGAIVMAAISYGGRQTLVPIEAFALDMPKNRMILPVEKNDLEAAPVFSEDTEDVNQFFDYWEVGFEEEEEE